MRGAYSKYYTFINSITNIYQLINIWKTCKKSYKTVVNITKKIGICSQNLVKKARYYLTNRYCNNKVSKLNVEFSFITHTMNLALLNFKFIPLFKQGWFEVIAFSHVLVFVKIMLLLISKVTGITFHGKMVPNKRGNVSSECQFQFNRSCPDWKPCHCDKY